MRTWPVLRSIPVAVEGFGHRAELDDEIAGEVFGLDLAPFFPPQAEQGASSSPMMIRASEPPIKKRRES